MLGARRAAEKEGGTVNYRRATTQRVRVHGLRLIISSFPAEEGLTGAATAGVPAAAHAAGVPAALLVRVLRVGVQGGPRSASRVENAL